jgi:tetratricopeptide (TPR) repeat protein
VATIGLALISKNEEATLPTLLASIEGAFDRVVLLDTGSTDDTVRIFREWAEAQSGVPGSFTYGTGFFDWVNDFAAARTAAEELLQRVPVEWVCWADCDDELVGAKNLRMLCDHCPSEAVALVADYAYAHDEQGNCVCTLKRERVVRAGHGTWTGRVHEAQLLDGPTIPVDPAHCLWVHRKPMTDAPLSSERNLRILTQWNDEEPGNPRVLAYLGTELAAQGQPEQAIQWFDAYLALDTGWPEERAQVHRKLATCLISTGDLDRAVTVALQGLLVVPGFADNYLSLAQASYLQGRHREAIYWAHETLRLGQPDTLLILNPLDYVVEPRYVLCASHTALGEWMEAVTHGEQALQLVPYHQMLAQGVAYAKREAKIHHTAQTFAGAARLLVAHDEQSKALQVLEDCVPHFAVDHPEVVGLRSMVRERLAFIDAPEAYERHYQEGGSKPEDAVEDYTAVCEQLPRARFLLDGLREQIEEAA